MILPLSLLLTVAQAETSRFVDATEELGLGSDAVSSTVSRLCFADLDDDGWSDVVLDRHLVFRNVPDEETPGGRKFVPVPPAETGLRTPDRATVTVFADMDGDGLLDAVLGEYVDVHKDGWTDHVRRTAWQRGNGDGTFGAPMVIPGVRPATTCAIAAADVDLDGRLDLFLGNWYLQYGGSYLGYPNELVRRGGAREWIVEPLPAGAPLDPAAAMDEDADAGGRSTYGAMIAWLFPADERPQLIELDYGRRWNRVWRWDGAAWGDVAPLVGLDADDVRHGRYPDWAIERMAQRDPPIELEPEKPFRSNGNTFDCAVGDVDGDGHFDLLVAEIAHGWAGEASDRTRLLFQRRREDGTPTFVTDPKCSLDRIPEGVDSWNQGDLFCALADLDHDTRLDVLVSSGDYPDDQRLRVWLQQPDGSLVDRTDVLGLDHDGSQQLSLADYDGDGDLDLLAGQTFVRYTKEMKEGREPLPRLFRNELTEGRGSITLRLEGDGKRVNRDALGAVVYATLPDGRTMVRQLVGLGGHAGKQHDFLVHFGLGDAISVAKLVVVWPEDVDRPDAHGRQQQFTDVSQGRYALELDGDLVRLDGE